MTPARSQTLSAKRWVVVLFLLGSLGISPLMAWADRGLSAGVAEVLRQLHQATGDGRLVDEARGKLKQAEPEGATPDALVSFLSKRATAADEVGDLAQRLADLQRAAELSKGLRSEDQHFYNLGLAEVLYGDVRAGQAALRHALALLEKNQQSVGLEILCHAILAYVDALWGRYDEAGAGVARARSLLDRVKARPGGGGGFAASWEMLTGFAEARLLVARGKWNEAEAGLRAAVAKGEETAGNLDRLIGMSPNDALQSNLLAGRNLVVAELVQHLIRMDKLDEAELVARDMLGTNLRRVGRLSIRSALMVVQLADVAAARGRHRDALALLDEAEDIARRVGIGKANRLVLAMLQSRVGVLLGMEDWPAGVEAEAAFRNRVREQAGLNTLDIFSPSLGIGLIRGGQALLARQRLDELVKRLADAMGPEHEQVAEARAVRAMALAALGERKAALDEFAVATRVLLERGVRDNEAQSRSQRATVRRLVLEAYLDLLAESPDVGDAAARAFRIADALHTGRTQQALAQSAARAAARQADLGELVRKDQDSQAEVSLLYRELLRLTGLPADRQLPKVMADMRRRISTIHEERRDREQQIERRFPAYANLVHPRPPALDEARSLLRPGEALVNVMSTSKASYVWAFQPTGPLAFVRAPLDREAIARVVASLRKALDPGEFDPAGALPAFDLDAAHRLYAALLAPVAMGWKGADSLLVVANGALDQLPPALLPTATTRLGREDGPRYANYNTVPWLIRDVALTQLPSVHAFVTLRKMPVASAGRRTFLGFGDPDFGGSTPVGTSRGLRHLSSSRVRAVTETSSMGMSYSSIPPLPDTREEIQELARVLGADLDRDVFLGSQASKAKLLQLDLTRSRILAFATHGLLPGEFPGVDQPSLALANPGGGGHGLLLLDDILGLRLDADWVILSACNTAAGDGAGAEAVSGLGRGFFYAGTRALLATHWPVESVSARLLVTGIFASQSANPDLSRAQALRHSMLALMARRAEPGGFSYAHPLFWAPYTLIGDGGR